MNRLLLLCMFIFGETLMFAQNVVIDGVTFSADRKTLIKYPADKVGEEYVIPEGTEIIDENAFNSAKLLSHVIFPFSLNEIKDYAFSFCHALTSVTWNNYPSIIGMDIFYESPIRNFYASDRANCVVVNNVLFSLDKKKLLRYPPVRRRSQEEYQYLEHETDYTVPEGTEVIGRLAFERANLFTVTLPSTLKMIEEGSFWVEARIPVGKINQVVESDLDWYWDLEYRQMNLVVCKAVEPPVLMGYAFGDPYWTDLYVPEESFDAYCYASGWTEFKHINDKHNPASIEEFALSGLRAVLDGHILNVTSARKILEIRLYALTGVLLMDKIVNDNSCRVEMSNQLPNLSLLEVVYENGVREEIKLFK